MEHNLCKVKGRISFNLDVSDEKNPIGALEEVFDIFSQNGMVVESSTEIREHSYNLTVVSPIMTSNDMESSIRLLYAGGYDA